MRVSLFAIINAEVYGIFRAVYRLDKDWFLEIYCDDSPGLESPVRRYRKINRLDLWDLLEEEQCIPYGGDIEAFPKLIKDIEYTTPTPLVDNVHSSKVGLIKNIPVCLELKDDFILSQSHGSIFYEVLTKDSCERPFLQETINYTLCADQERLIGCFHLRLAVLFISGETHEEIVSNYNTIISDFISSYLQMKANANKSREIFLTGADLFFIACADKDAKDLFSSEVEVYFSDGKDTNYLELFKQHNHTYAMNGGEVLGWIKQTDTDTIIAFKKSWFMVQQQSKYESMIKSVVPIILKHYGVKTHYRVYKQYKSNLNIVVDTYEVIPLERMTIPYQYYSCYSELKIPCKEINNMV